jgi:peptidoglycan/LPS O-acetylase OafA/YrhL
MSNREIKALTSLRMIAALLVFFHHFYPFAHTGDVLENILIEGHIGVTIFFVLSGFLIALRYYDEFRENGLTRSGMIDYYRKRFARIYPLYAFLLIASLFVPFRFEGVVQYTLTQGFFERMTLTGIRTAWSLTVEESFYFLLPLVAVMPLFTHRIQSKIAGVFLKLVIAVAVLLGLGMVIVSVSNAIGLVRIGGFMANSEHMLIYTIFGRFFDFAVGILIAIVYKHSQIRAWYARLSGRIGAEALVIGGVIWTAFSVNLMHVNGGYSEAWGLNYCVSVGAGLVILGLANEQTASSRILGFPLLVYMGRTSYALYLVQATWLFRDVNYGNFIIQTPSPCSTSSYSTPLLISSVPCCTNLSRRRCANLSFG